MKEREEWQQGGKNVSGEKRGVIGVAKGTPSHLWLASHRVVRLLAIQGWVII